jgi:hypothetical protein
VPTGVELPVETLSVEEPEPPTEVGLKLPLAPLGNPLTLKLTLAVKPPDDVTVAVYEVPAPAVTVCELGVAEMAKSPPPPPVGVALTCAELGLSPTEFTADTT